MGGIGLSSVRIPVISWIFYFYGHHSAGARNFNRAGRPTDAFPEAYENIKMADGALAGRVLTRADVIEATLLDILTPGERKKGLDSTFAVSHERDGAAKNIASVCK